MQSYSAQTMKFLKLIFTLSLFLSINGYGGEKPNFLFIAVDDLRPELGVYGKKYIQTPHIDQLSNRGVVFTRAYCQVAVCGASRASLMTGLRPTPKRFLNYLTYAEKDAPNAITLPQELKSRGYHTISNGKIFHHKNDTARRSWSEPSWRPSTGGAKFLDPLSKTMIGGKKNRGPVLEFPDVPDNAYPDGQIADKTIQDLEQLKERDQPFFLACGFLKPHLPFYAPKKYWDLYEADEIDLADNQYTPLHAPKSLRGSTEIDSYHNRGMVRNSADWHRSCRHGYYACVSYIDAQIGRIMESLERLGLDDNTYVILWGDHGFHLGEHNFWGKHNVMHFSTHSPLIVSGPNIKHGSKCKELVEFVDIYPTILELSGDPSDNNNLQGTSFKILLNQPNTPWKPAVFSKFGPAVSLITKDYNYAEFSNGDRMLFQLDPLYQENENLVNNPDYAKVRDKLSTLLQKGWRNALPNLNSP